MSTMERTAVSAALEDREQAERALDDLRKSTGIADIKDILAPDTGLPIDGPAVPVPPVLASTGGSVRARDASLGHLAQDRHRPLAGTSLTRREREVAVLVACGLNNRQIAEALVIAKKTAEAYVGRILGKLGLRRRGQVAAWTLINAQRALQARDESLATIAHDLKNPLNAIQTGAYALERYASPADPERWRAGLAAIQASAVRMDALVDELLEVARPEAPRPADRRRRPTDLVALAREVVAHHQPAAPRHRLRVDAAEPQLVGPWDAAQLARVLDNLLGNAIKYSPAGGPITVRVAREEDGAGARAVLAVQDQGLGIPAGDLPHVFEPFCRAGNVAGRMAGTGLGLTGARRIVEQHGGTIAVASREHAGTTLTVRLPLPAERRVGKPSPRNRRRRGVLWRASPTVRQTRTRGWRRKKA